MIKKIVKQETKGDTHQSREWSLWGGTVKEAFLKNVTVEMAFEESVDRHRRSKDSEGLREVLKEKLNEEVEMLGHIWGNTGGPVHPLITYLLNHPWGPGPELSIGTKISLRHSLRPKRPEMCDGGRFQSLGSL